MKGLIKIIICILVINSFSCKQLDKKDDFIEPIPVSNSKLEHVEPTNWWIGLKEENLQLLVKEDNIGTATAKISYSGVTIDKVHKADSPNYLFLDLKFQSIQKLENLILFLSLKMVLKNHIRMS